MSKAKELIESLKSMAEGLSGEQHHKLLRVMQHAVTQHDVRQSKKKHYNPYALPAYLGKVKEIADKAKKGGDHHAIIDKTFNGSLHAVVKKAVTKHYDNNESFDENTELEMPDVIDDNEIDEKSNSYTVEKSGEHNMHLVKHAGNTVGSVQKLRPGEGHKVSFKEGRQWRHDTKHADTHEKAVAMIKKHHQGHAQI